MKELNVNELKLVSGGARWNGREYQSLTGVASTAADHGQYIGTAIGSRTGIPGAVLGSGAGRLIGGGVGYVFSAGYNIGVAFNRGIGRCN